MNSNWSVVQSNYATANLANMLVISIAKFYYVAPGMTLVRCPVSCGSFAPSANLTHINKTKHKYIIE